MCDTEEEIEPEIRLACKTGYRDGYEDMEWAVLTLTLPIALMLLKHMSVAEVLASSSDVPDTAGFHRVTYFSYLVDYYPDITAVFPANSAAAAAAAFEENIDTGYWEELPAATPLADVTRTECDMVHVGDDRVLFSAVMKNCDTETETQPLMKIQLAEASHALLELKAAAAAKFGGTRKEQRVIQLDKQ